MFRITRSSVAGHGGHLLSSGRGDELHVLDLGGTVRELSLSGPGGGRGTSLLVRSELDAIEYDPLFRGRLLFPFNDRIPGGRYRFGGAEHRLRVNSPVDGSAIHGFLYRRVMECVGETAEEDCAKLVLRDRIGAADEPGYPFPISLRVEYELGPGRCRLGFRLRNVGDSAAPFGLGWHPYFSLGVPADDLVLTHGGERFVPVGEDLLPLGGLEPVTGSPFDFRTGRRLGKAALDTALCAPADGRCTLSRPGGPGLELAADPALFAFTQLYIPPDRRSVALEPVSSPTDAFNRPELGLPVLEPGEERRGWISVRLL
ncbi:MAG TPA: aldose 1-epimerase [Rectinemataceae bacterium]|nr:aldose 1-epimerase [Rectinemataceae bacterium]